MQADNRSLRRTLWLLSALGALFVVVWQAPAFHAVQGLANYLPLHMFAETFSIVVSMMVFGVAWNGQSKERSDNIVILACALLAVGLLDFAHMLSFKGMPDFITPSGPEKAINLWLAARMVAAVALLVVALRPLRTSFSRGARYWLLVGSLVFAMLVIWAGMVYPQAWPRTFIAGQGLTPFKIGAEYSIIAILLIPAARFYAQAKSLQSRDANNLFAATVITILSELSFTLYSDVADMFNLLGHLYKIVAYIFIYRVVFIGTVREPFQRLDAEFTENSRIAKELQAASRYTRSLIEASLDPLVTISADGKITDVNNATEQATGRSRAELIGTDFCDYFTNPEQAREGYRSVFAQGLVTDYPLVLRHRDGHLTDVLYNASIYRNEAGEVAGVFAAARDISKRKAAENELRQSEALLRVSQHLAKVGAWEFDVKSGKSFWSEELYRIHEMPHDPSMDHVRESLQCYSPEDRTIISAAFNNVCEKGEPYDLELPFTTHKGNRLWIRTTAQAVYEQGKVVRVIGNMIDLTERKQAEEALRLSSERLQLATRFANIGIWDWDIPRNELVWDDSMYQLYGLRKGDFGGAYDAWISTVHPDDKAHTDGEIQAALRGEREYAPEFRIIRADGAIRHIKADSRTSRDAEGRPLRMIGTNIDITELKQAEMSIRKLNQELEQRVAERTAQLETAIYDLENINYSASHDLRIPLRAVDGFSRILLDEYSDKLDAEGRRLLNVVRDNTRKMERYIDDMLTFSSIGRAAMKPVEVGMTELAREVAGELVHTAGGREPKVEIAGLPPAIADRAMMRQVLHNLLANALKFSRAKADARIEIGALGAEGETVYFVRDNGVGFDMQYADKLFGVFQRLHGVEEFEGVGIGLAIVKRIVTRHGGRVWAEGKVDAGATFYFSLPSAARREASHGNAENT